MNEKKYLKWYNKVGYGSGDIAGNAVYVLLSTFVMFYLTNTAGLNAGVIGTLMMLARIFDGVSDIFFGAIIDKTRTRMGRAREPGSRPGAGDGGRAAQNFRDSPGGR